MALILYMKNHQINLKAKNHLLAKKKNKMEVMNMGGGLLSTTVLPGIWSGLAGLTVYAVLLAVLRGAGLPDILVLLRCARPAGRDSCVRTDL